jgi:hypothetical protein
MINDRYLGDVFTRILLKENEAERKKHEPSGKLTASMLGDPLLWQILKVMGVPAKEVDEYAVALFARGHSVEDFVIDKLKKGAKIIETQKEVEYRGVVGLVDAVIDTSKHNYDVGVIPHEIKSVKNSKFKRIMSANEADLQHRWQATLYALAMGCKQYAIVYVAADDLRMETFIYNTMETNRAIDDIIDRFDKAVKEKTIPEFKEVFDWQKNPDYAKYPWTIGKSQKEIAGIVTNSFREIYNNWKGQR